MKNILKNIVAILIRIWIISFQILLIIIGFIGAMPLFLFKGEKIILFKRNQKQWKITEALEKINDYFEDLMD